MDRSTAHEHEHIRQNATVETRESGEGSHQSAADGRSRFCGNRAATPPLQMQTSLIPDCNVILLPSTAVIPFPTLPLKSINQPKPWALLAPLPHTAPRFSSFCFQDSQLHPSILSLPALLLQKKVSSPCLVPRVSATACLSTQLIQGAR